MSPRLAAVLLGLWASLASAHPQGFHKKLTFTVAKDGVRGLVVMDVDGGDRCRLVRAGADENHDGQLSKAEVEALKARLVAMATKTLVLGLSGAPLGWRVVGAKLSLREDRTASDSGLSVAVLLEAGPMPEVFPGTRFEVADAAPDLSEVVVEVFQAAAPGKPAEAPFREVVESGKKIGVRLGTLGAQAP